MVTRLNIIPLTNHGRFTAGIQITDKQRRMGMIVYAGNNRMIIKRCCLSNHLARCTIQRPKNLHTRSAKFKNISLLYNLNRNVSFAASKAFNDFKAAVKQDIQNTKADIRTAAKKDIEAKKAQDIAAAKTKKAAKLKEIETKLTELNKELTAVKKSTTMTQTEKTIKARALEKQIDFYNKQKASLK